MTNVATSRYTGNPGGREDASHRRPLHGPAPLTPERMLGEAGGARVIYRSDIVHPRHHANFRVFDSLDFLAEVSAHTEWGTVMILCNSSLWEGPASLPRQPLAAEDRPADGRLGDVEFGRHDGARYRMRG